jgi:predicted flap endonuclease-1-like 5' DNA nuclease
MHLSYIFLNSFTENLPVGLALCIVPFILGWLAAYLYYKVPALRDENAALNLKVNEQNNAITELRMHLSKTEAELETRAGDLRKSKDALVMCESERNALREQVSDGGKSSKSVKAPPKAPEEVRTVMFAGAKVKWDDLEIVEGIGPKIAKLLHDAGITSWDQLSMTSPYRLREILDAGGPQYNIHDPETWPKQADLAAKEHWDALKTLQDELIGGKAG